MTAARGAKAEPTIVARIEEFLAKADDFVTAKMIAEGTEIPIAQVLMALYHHRRKYLCFDCIEQDAALWWFLTPDTDKRTKRFMERRPEGLGSRGGDPAQYHFNGKGKPRAGARKPRPV